MTTAAMAQVSRQDPASFVNQQRMADERVRAQLDAEPAGAMRGLFDWGGWYSFYGFVFDDGVESSRTLRRHDLRLWGRLQLDEGAHEFYVRPRLSFVDFNSGDSYDGNDDDWDGPNLERGFYRLNLGQALPGQLPDDLNIIGTFGRDLVTFGNSLTLAAPLDHVAIKAIWRDWELTGLAGKTVGSMPDFDLSRTAERNHRNFLGAELRYHGFDRHEPFLYALFQRDQNEEEVYAPFQEFDYDSNYLGIGSMGQLGERWRYESEWVYETGSSYGDHRWYRTNDIRAWAIDNEIEYLFPGPRRARASFEYLIASGDGTRRLSPTDSRGGNQFDFEDNSFIAFGYKDTGLSFAPRYGNLHMWRAGGSLFPWHDNPTLRYLELGTDWYVFHKQQRDGAVSDPTADRRAGYLGFEMDYFANWQVTADLSWTTRLGVFFPGDAFSDRTTRTFLLVGITWSF